MKLGLISDTHDQTANVRKALALFREKGVELLVHCGDMESESTAALFDAIPTHVVTGNCDYDEASVRDAITRAGGTYHGMSGQLEIEGVRIAWTHGHDKRLLNHLIECGKWDYVFHGHTHIRRHERIGETVVINPGALHRAAVKTVGILDLPAGTYGEFEI